MPVHSRLVEDRYGSKIRLNPFNTRLHMTISGYLAPGTERISTRRANVKKKVGVYEILPLREKLLDIVESDAFQRSYSSETPDEDMEFGIRIMDGILKLGFDRGQFYIAVSNTVGVRKIVFQDGDRTIRDLTEALQESTEWFPHFFTDNDLYLHTLLYTQ